MAQGLLDALDNPVRNDSSAHVQQFTVRSVASNYMSVARN